MNATERCPSCARSNAVTRQTCLYCGANLPEPRPAAAQGQIELPPDLDELVRQALSGGSVSKVKAALDQARTARAATASASLAAPSPLSAGRPGRPEAASSEAPSAPAALSLDVLLAELRGLSEQADVAWRGRRPSEVVVALGALRRTLSLVEAHPGLRAAPPGVVLPPIRQPWILIVEGAGDGGRAAAMALALEVDNATARMLAVARCPRVAMRGDDRAHLTRLSRRVVEIVGVGAAVASRDDLLCIGPPRTWLRADGPGQLWVTDEAVWFGGAEGVDGQAAEAGPIYLAVPGEIVHRRIRRGPERRGGRSTDLNERRVAVLDLHGPREFYRLVEGVTETAGLPGFEVNGARRSLRGFTERLGEWWPELTAVEGRVCQPGDAPSPSPTGERPDVVEITGWPLWEEHTRLCRLLAGLGVPEAQAIG